MVFWGAVAIVVVGVVGCTVADFNDTCRVGRVVQMGEAGEGYGGNMRVVGFGRWVVEIWGMGSVANLVYLLPLLLQIAMYSPQTLLDHYRRFILSLSPNDNQNSSIKPSY